jgi:catechol 2,3-dioxygenase-like lactoylglutathione lyase family enzyme
VGGAAAPGPVASLRAMACRLTEIVVDSRDPEALAAFWSAVLGYRELSREEGEIEIGPDEGFGGPAPTLVFSRSADPRPRKLRWHVDVSPTDRDQDAELERLLSLGARPADVGQTGEESWHVLADPEGNEFCLLRRQV